MALDPLSSQRLFNSLATGLEAGQATLALLARDVAATRRHADRMGQIWQAYVRHDSIYYGMEPRWLQAPFWARRAVGSK